MIVTIFLKHSSKSSVEWHYTWTKAVDESTFPRTHLNEIIWQVYSKLHGYVHRWEVVPQWVWWSRNSVGRAAVAAAAWSWPRRPARARGARAAGTRPNTRDAALEPPAKG